MAGYGKAKILPGAKIGMLTVTGARHSPDGRVRIVICRCECGKVKEIRSSNVSKNKENKSCGCTAHNEKTAQADRHALTALITIYERNATTRKPRISFLLTRGEFLSLVKSDCYYCGAPPTQRIKTKFMRRTGSDGFLYNGIDRENSDHGYTPANSRPCCARCNYAKLRMSAVEYVEHCEKVARHSATTPRSLFD